MQIVVGNKSDNHSLYALRFLEKYMESARENRDVAAAKKMLKEMKLLGFDLRWRIRIPGQIKWYDHNFENVVWSDKAQARRYIDQALELISKDFTKDEVMQALYRILCVKESEEEIREAEGLLG